jgi:hypothetical protein
MNTQNEQYNKKTGYVCITCHEARSRNRCCRGKAISITYSECVFVVLFIRRNILSCIRLYNIYRIISGNVRFSKTLLNTECVILFYPHLSTETLLILIRIQRGIIIICKCLHVKCPLFWSDFNETLIFPTDFRKKNSHIKISWKIEWENYKKSGHSAQVWEIWLEIISPS